jgi:hypothetical protein
LNRFLQHDPDVKYQLFGGNYQAGPPGGAHLSSHSHGWRAFVTRTAPFAVVGSVEGVDRIARLLLLTVLVLVTSFQAASAASDTALRAMYCVPVMDAAIAVMRNGQEVFKSSRKELIEAERDLASDRERLASYGLLEMRHRGTALLTAKRRGEIDARQCAAEEQSDVMDGCSSRCISKCTPGDIACIQQCYSSCSMPTCTRTAACINPTWLPY